MDAGLKPPPTDAATNGDAVPQTVDYCVLGGGMVGLFFARQLRECCGEATVLVLDDGGGERDDGKSIVINPDSADMLESLAALPPDSRPIRRARISFQDGGGATFNDGRILGYGIADDTVRQSLRQGLTTARRRVLSVQEETDSVRIQVRDENNETTEIRARAFISSCAAPVLPPAFQTRIQRYRQTVLSFTATASDYQDGDAFQCFNRRGVAVVVPRADNALGVILCATPSLAGGLNALDERALSSYLRSLIDLSLQTDGKRHAYAPRLSGTRPLASRRIALIGQGATVLHPIGAQGLNLGMGDARLLAECIAAQADECPVAALQRYGKQRIHAHRRAALLTGTLALGVRCRALPFRLIGGAVASFLGLAPLQQRVLARVR